MSTQINKTNNSANSICIPRAFANINEARVRKVFDVLKIFVIDRVDMIQRKNEKGEPYQRIFIHIKEWSKSADADKSRERLLSGKELKIVYDEPWFWKVSLNNWTPKPAPVPITSVYDRKPRIRLDFDDKEEKDENEEELPYDIRWGDELARRKRQVTKKNIEAAASFLSEDQRPYGERRLDPVYCDQDVQSGFRDRRLPSENVQKEQRKSRFSDNNQKQDQPLLVIAPPLPDVEVEVEVAVAVKSEYKMDPEMIRLICIYLKIGKSELTEEIYKNNAQRIRDIRQDELLAAEENEKFHGAKIEYTDILPAPKRKQRKIILEEENAN